MPPLVGPHLQSDLRHALVVVSDRIYIRLMRIALLLCLAYTLAAAQPASAGWRTDRALAIANVVWNNPCNGQIEVRWARLDGEAGGQVTLGECALTMSTRYPWSWQAFCRVVIHEVGHIAGMPHSTNPRSVMWPETWTNFDKALIGGEWVSQRDRRCRDRGRPYLEQHGML